MICQAWKVLFQADYSSGQPLRMLVDLRASIDHALGRGNAVEADARATGSAQPTAAKTSPVASAASAAAASAKAAAAAPAAATQKSSAESKGNNVSPAQAKAKSKFGPTPAL